ncbi:MAG: hypothetical protein CBD26_03020 [Candidatus Pelagibacter sp. TMED166]|nr:MAG: hypothetical protein CBD26_03020 [Candidatus Pelagibacter sp. TMED166]|tara:strand:+ start:27479 stop:28399 length:921 start_codon:yes stop_codon:yes gene_type:complete
MKLISVIIPTFNRVDLLKNAINSVLTQTYSNIEIIVIDDNSNDNTESLIKNLNDNRINYIKNKENLKAPLCRNIGINISRGEFIAFLDDDDIWYHNKLEEQIKLFDNSNVGLVYCVTDLFFENYNLTYSTKPQKRGNIFNDILVNNYIGATPSVVVRKEALKSLKIKKNEYFDTSFEARQDYDLWIRICKRWDVDFVSKSLLKQNYRKNLVRISSDLNNHINAHKKINNKYKNDIILNLSDHQIKERLINQDLFLAAQAIKISNIKLARKHYLNALKRKKTLKLLLFYLSSILGAKFMIKLRSYKK